MTPYVETGCTFTHEGRTFEAGGAVVTPDHVIAYPKADGVHMTTERTMRYGYSLWYSLDASRREIPNEQGPSFPSSVARDADLARHVADLEAQGYNVYRVERFIDCGHCEGVGTVLQRPKGWRKRTPPPWFMCKRVACPECRNNPRTVETDTVLT